MKFKSSLFALALALLCWGGLQNAQAQYAGVGCYESGEISCAPACEPSCAPSCGVGAYGGVGYYGDDGCYDACNVGYYGGYCGEGLFAGIGCILSGAVNIVAPIHWVASLFCRHLADCSCAPHAECYSDPCDICGSYVGDPCGGCETLTDIRLLRANRNREGLSVCRTAPNAPRAQVNRVWPTARLSEFRLREI